MYLKEVKMKRLLRRTAAIMAVVMTSVSLHASDAVNVSVIPKPNELKIQKGEAFTLNTSTSISYEGEVAKKAAKMLGLYLRPATDYPKKGDFITITFERPLKPKTIEILTGFSRTSDWLKNGALEVSYDGVNFNEEAIFKEGKLGRFSQSTAEAVITKPFKAVRIMVTGDQNKCLIVREIILK